MLAFNHILAGSIVAVITPAPLVPVVAFATHYLLDLMPHAHGEEPPYSRFLKIQIIADGLICIPVIIFILAFFPDQWFIISVGAFFGLLPDLLWIFWKKGGPKWFQAFLDWAHWIQWGERRNGWIFDAFYGFIFIFILFLLAGRALILDTNGLSFT